jgi:energy-coupling factor transporter ATP-binding protein EcfA2
MRIADDLPGRSGVLGLFGEFLERMPEAPRDLPVLIMLGPRGSGKTTVLRYLAQALKPSVSIPYAHLDCAERGRDRAGRLLGDLADELYRHWEEFGTPRFPRLTLGRLATGSAQLPDDLHTAKERLLDLLRQRARLTLRGEAASGTVLDLAQALDFPMGQANLVGRAIRAVAGSGKSVEARYHTGLSWYAARAGQNGDGPAELVKLNWLAHREDGDSQEP